MGSVEIVKELVRKECMTSAFADKGVWFFPVHLLAVEKYAQWLLERLPEANKEIVMLAVWLHDIQRIRMINGDHQEVGAVEAEKVLSEQGCDKAIIDRVTNVIKTHSCNDGNLPVTLEGEILATADAMSHFVNDFYLHIATLGDRTVDEFKQWALEKLDRDYNIKIHFDFAREEVKDKYAALLKVMEMG